MQLESKIRRERSLTASAAMILTLQAVRLRRRNATGSVCGRCGDLEYDIHTTGDRFHSWSGGQKSIGLKMRPLCVSLILVCVSLAGGLCGCSRTSRQEPAKVISPDGGFAVTWPPSDLARRGEEPFAPLLHGELLVDQVESNDGSTFQLRVTLRRPNGDADRKRWNETLAFPEYSWMANVRVWDDEYQWLWPNLPFLLRAHGEQREERYGGVDPAKGVDNDFAALLVRPLNGESTNSRPPLVSAEWHPVGAENPGKQTIVHVARSDEFRICVSPSDGRPLSGRLGVWLIYADFLGAATPAAWPVKDEYAGGILAYLEVDWQRNADGQLSFEINHLVPPTDTGFDWEGWSTGAAPLEKNLQLTLPPVSSES